MIRRDAREIERVVGTGRFVVAIDRCGCQVVEAGYQIVIFCNRAPLRWLTRPATTPIPLS